MSVSEQHVRTMATIVSSLCLLVLVPLNAWALNRLVEHGERLGRMDERMVRIERTTQSYYLMSDATKDQALLLRILEGQGKTIEDIEGRLRIIERRQ